jgi:hypothetical protein
VDLTPANAVPSTILLWLMHPELQPLAAMRTTIELEAFGTEERVLLLDRVRAALNDDVVVAVLHPPPEPA